MSGKGGKPTKDIASKTSGKGSKSSSSTTPSNDSKTTPSKSTSKAVLTPKKETKAEEENLVTLPQPTEVSKDNSFRAFETSDKAFESTRDSPSFMEVAFMNDPQRLFESLISPYTLEEFFGSYWEKQPMLMKRNDPTFFNGLYSRSDFFTEVEEHERKYKLELEELAARKKNGESHENESIHDSTMIDADNTKNSEPLLFGTHLNVVVYNGKKKIVMNPHQNYTAEGAHFTMRAMLKALRNIRLQLTKKDKKTKSGKKAKAGKNTSNSTNDLYLANEDVIDVDLGDEDNFSYEDPELDAIASQDYDPAYAKKAYEGLSRREIVDRMKEEDEAREKLRSIITLREVADLFKVGCTLQVIHPQQRSTSVWRALYLLESFMGSLVGSNCYITPSGTQGLSPHHDDVDVFVCQLEGSKTWKLYPPVSPLAQTCSNDLPRSILQPGITVTLAPGDSLYLPRGTVHEAIADAGAEYSSHLTISCSQTSTWFHLLQIALQAAVTATSENNLALRQSLPLNAQAFMGTLHDKDVTMQSFMNDVVVTPDAGTIDSVDQEEYQRLLSQQKPLAQRGDEDEDEDEDEDMTTSSQDANDIVEDIDMASTEGDNNSDENSFQTNDLDSNFTSTDLPYTIIADGPGYTNWSMFFRYGSPSQLNFLLNVRQGAVQDNAQTLLESILKNVDIHAAMDELQRDFALHRLPPPPPLSMDGNVVGVLSCKEVKDIVFKEIQEEVNHSDLTGILSAKLGDTLNDAFDVIAKVDLYSAIRFRNVADLLITVEPTSGMDNVTQTATGESDQDDNSEISEDDSRMFDREEDEDNFNIFEEMDEDMVLEDEDQDHDQEQNTAIDVGKKLNLGVRKVYVPMNESDRQSLIPSKQLRQSHSSIEADSAPEFINAYDEDEDEDGHNGEDDVFNYQMSQLARLPEHPYQVSVYTSSRNDHTTHMGIGTGKLSKVDENNPEENQKEEQLQSMCLGLSPQYASSGESDQNEDEDEDQGENEDDMRAQFDVPLKANIGANPIAFPLATLPAFRQLASNNSSFTHVGDLEIDWEFARQFKMAFDIMTPFDLMGARGNDTDLPFGHGDEDEDEDNNEDDSMIQNIPSCQAIFDNTGLSQVSNSTTHQTVQSSLGPLCERVRLMFLHWFVADLYAKGLIEIVINGDDARELNKDRTRESKSFLKQFHYNDQDEEEEDEDEDEDLSLVTEEYNEKDDNDNNDDDILKKANDAFASFSTPTSVQGSKTKKSAKTTNDPRVFFDSSNRAFHVSAEEWDPSKLHILHRIHDTIISSPRQAPATLIVRKVNEEASLSKFHKKCEKNGMSSEGGSEYIPKGVVLRAITLFAAKNAEMETAEGDVIEVSTEMGNQTQPMSSDSENESMNVSFDIDGNLDIDAMQSSSLRMMMSALHGTEMGVNWDNVAEEDVEDMEDMEDVEDIEILNPEDEDENEDEDDDANAYDKMSARTRRVLQQAYEEEQAQLAQAQAQHEADEDEDLGSLEDLEDLRDALEDGEDNEDDFEGLEELLKSQAEINAAKQTNKKTNKPSSTRPYDMIPLYGKNKPIADRLSSVPKVDDEEFLLVQKKAPSADEHEANQALLFEKLAGLMTKTAPRRRVKVTAVNTTSTTSGIIDSSGVTTADPFKMERSKSSKDVEQEEARNLSENQTVKRRTSGSGSVVETEDKPKSNERYNHKKRRF